FLLDNFFDLIPVGAMLPQRPCGKHPILCGSRQYSTHRRAFSCAFLQIRVPKWPFCTPSLLVTRQKLTRCAFSVVGSRKRHLAFECHNDYQEFRSRVVPSARCAEKSAIARRCMAASARSVAANNARSHSTVPAVAHISSKHGN